MKIKQSKNKTYIMLEYPQKLIHFGSIYKSDLNRLYLKIFLKNGDVISEGEIKMITFAVKEFALNDTGEGK